jgi:predicted kinase
MKKAVLFIGLPGSGKTTIVNKVYGDYNIVSADIIKSTHTDYDQKHPELLHQWSVKEAENNMIDLSDKGVDICMDSGGVNNSYSLRIMNMLKSKGYNLTLVYVDTPLNVCIERNEKRERNIPEYVIIEKSIKLKDCLEKQKLVVDEFIHILGFVSV